MGFVKDFVDNLMRKRKEDIELDKEINDELRTMRLDARKDRMISVEKAKLDFRKEQEIKIAKQQKPKGNFMDIGDTFAKFQNFAAGYAKRQQASPSAFGSITSPYDSPKKVKRRKNKTKVRKQKKKRFYLTEAV